MKDVTPKKSLGQHWLHDVDTLNQIVESAEVEAEDHVLEIGPGLGTLTEILLSTGAHVIAVEYDAELYKLLETETKQFYSEDSKRLELVHQDILKFDLTTMPAGYKAVANIPYYLTSNLIRVLSESVNPPAKVVLLIQKEVAERIAAKPGDMSLLSVTAQFYWEIRLGIKVPARLFTPPPKVDSQVIIMSHRPAPLFSGVESKTFFRLVKAGFAARRKTLLNSLAGGMHQSKQEISEILTAAEISPTCRPQELSLEDWHRVYQNLPPT